VPHGEPRSGGVCVEGARSLFYGTLWGSGLGYNQYVHPRYTYGILLVGTRASYEAVSE